MQLAEGHADFVFAVSHEKIACYSCRWLATDNAWFSPFLIWRLFVWKLRCGFLESAAHGFASLLFEEFFVSEFAANSDIVMSSAEVEDFV